tara:strand:- start:3206 stop:4039 length:834 start_codon:yes stop_codon:yes gene_type:complete
MKIPFLITARLKSNRLKKKIIRKVKNQELLSHMIKRIKHAKNISNIVVCTSNLKEDNPLNEIAKKNSVDIYKGSPNDVILRLFNAAKKFNARYIVNITADCPLIDPYYIDLVAKKITENKFDLVRTFDLPHGIFVYGIRVKALKTICKMKKKKNTEIWERYFTDTGLFKIFDINIRNKSHKKPGLRLTVDYPEDLSLIKKIFDKLWGKKKLFDTTDIIKLFQKEPNLLKINSNCAEKFSKKYNQNDQILIENKYLYNNKKSVKYKTFHEFLYDRGVR